MTRQTARADAAPFSTGRLPLWQVPVFFLGVASLAAVLGARPPWRDGAARQLERDLASARQALAKPDGDAGRVPALMERVLAGRDRWPHRAGEAFFLLGSAHARLADQAAGDDALGHWRAALDHLRQAESLGVPDDDRPALQYRLGKAGFHTGDDPRRVADRLAASVEQAADDRAEGYALLTQAYLRLPEPDLRAALRANEALRQLPLLNEEVLAPARLAGSELLLRLGKPEAARRLLEKVGDQAPPELAARALLLRAGSLHDEERWSEAAPLWRQALAAPRRLAPGDLGPALYRFGTCLRNLEQPAEAADAWQECVARGGKDEAAAAALGLAELRLAEGNPEAAASAFERAVRDVRRPEDWHNPLADLKRLREAFERGCRGLREAGHHESALRVARLYERAAAPGEAPLLRARAAEAWAVSLGEQATGPEADRIRGEARELFRQAGAAAEESAKLGPVGEEAPRLWQSAGHFLRGEDFGRAAEVLARFIELEQQAKRSDRLGEAWFLLAETHRERKDWPSAGAAYRQCLLYPGPFEYRARFQLARAENEAKNLDAAVELLEQNLKLLQAHTDPEAQEQTLFLLGALLSEQKKYGTAAARLEEALVRYPNNADALTARYRLAESYRHQAVEEGQKLEAAVRERQPQKIQELHQQERQKLLLRVAAEYRTLAEALEKVRAGRPLSAGEEAHVVNALLTRADALYHAGQVDDARRGYLGLAERYPNRVERLSAWWGVAQCHYYKKEFAGAEEYVRRIEAALNDADVDDKTRQGWQEYLQMLKKPAGR